MTIKYTSFGVSFLIVAIASGVAAKESPQEICKSQMLSYRQRYQCQQQLENIHSKADQKAVVRKYSDLIRAAEKEKAEK